MPRLFPARLRAVDRRSLLPGVAAFTVAGVVALAGLRATADPRSDGRRAPEGTTRIQLLGVNDFHGHLEPPRPGIGGASWLASHLDRAAAASPGRTIRVHAGDMVGASPLVSSHFKDEPSIEAMNLMEFDVGTVGNHEFDEGGDELLRLLRRARFPYVAANTFDRAGRLVLPPYQIVERAGVKVGFIGVTTEATPQFLLARHAARFTFEDISDSVNRWVPEVRRRGAEAIVVLAHSGAVHAGGASGKAVGEIIDETREMSEAIDVVVAGHTHSHLNTRVANTDGPGDKVVVEALSYGTAFDRVELTVDRPSGEVIAKAADIPRTRHAEAPPDREMQGLVERYSRRVAPLANRVIASTPRDVTRSSGALGDLAADAQRALAGADIALVNPGNLRDDLRTGDVTYADLFRVHAYEHPVMRMRLRGADVRAALAQQRARGGPVRLHLSGLADARDLVPHRTYIVAANELIATGARFSVLRDRGRAKRRVGTDLEAMVDYLRRHPAALGQASSR